MDSSRHVVAVLSPDGCVVGTSREGIINPHPKYSVYESILFMNWHGFFSFIVPSSLLLVFPELTLVHCGRADTTEKCEEKNGCKE
jgi:hypothetical protein